MAIKRTFGKWVTAALIGSLFVACVETPPNEVAEPRRPSANTASPTPIGKPIGGGGLEAPPPVTVRFFDQAIELYAWTFCYSNGCADGAPPSDPPHVGNPDEVFVEFALPDWSFKASFSPADEKCGRVQTVPLETISEGRFVLRPAGHADDYEITLFGRGDGDLFTTFHWTTPTDGPLPTPRARLAVLAGSKRRVDSYGIELQLTNLARTPRKASATITVRSEDGDALTFDATRSDTQCHAEGTVYWDGPDDKGLAATELGDGTFTYKVDLMLDGARYVARATWPDDEIPGNAPSVRLDFEPPLPALR